MFINIYIDNQRSSSHIVIFFLMLRRPPRSTRTDTLFPYTTLFRSGEGPNDVTISPIKAFHEPYGKDIALRIAALEPQHYTRAGAALLHASTLLMKQPTRHRLLLLLSDGKPNDVDQYEGRYGFEDMRRAVRDAKQQGIFPFCLTIA